MTQKGQNPPKGETGKYKKTLAIASVMLYNTMVLGDMAQLVERYVRIV